MATAPVSPASPTRVEHEPPRLKATWQKYGAPVLVLLLATAVIVTLTRNWNAWEGSASEQVTNDAFVRGDLTPLSTKVPGLVREVNVGDYQQVHKGDVLIQLEAEDYEAQLAQAEAAVEAAKAAIENNRRQSSLQDSRIERAAAGIDQAKAQIAAPQAASREADLRQARTLLHSNELAVEAERRSKAVLESQGMQLLADLHAKQAGLAVAQVNLGYTKILAPADRTVGERQVRPGQLVSPGTQVITFVENTRWVQANFRETQLTNIRIGDTAEIRIDVYPGQVIQGKVLQIAPASGSQFALLPPDNATGNFTKVVQRVPVKISLDSSALTSELRPGLSAVVKVRIRK